MAETDLKSLRIPRDILADSVRVAKEAGMKQAQVLIRWMRVGWERETGIEAQDIKKSRSVAAGDGAQGLVSPDPVFGGGGEFPGMTGSPINMEPFRPKVYPREPDVVFGEEEKFMDAPFNYSEVPKVPEGITSHFEKVREAQALAEMASGADPGILNAPEKLGARTAAGIERVDQQLTKKATVPKSKKIARVSSPDAPPLNS
jgi:hypothetical protein